jgi:hypothetical protein
MKDDKGSLKPMDAEVAGATVEAHGVMVTPVARVRGKADARSEENGSWRYAWAAIQPVKMTVRDQTGQTSEVKLAPTEGQVLGAMAVVGLLVAVIALVISALAGKQR